MKSNAEISDSRFLGAISASSIRNLLPRSMSTKQKTHQLRAKSRLGDENTPPIDSNIQICSAEVTATSTKKSESEIMNLRKEIAELNCRGEESVDRDPSVKVVVRIRPLDGHERDGNFVRKVSSDSLSVGDRKFAFDSVLESNSNQEDIFKLVGVPLVKNALAGFNTSVLSYGQTGSGKTYTLWGPPSAMVEGHSPYGLQGIVPRIFQMLFSEIQREREDSEKQTNYQCRCSFLEIYNEQIGDLLDTTQRDLEIKDDPKNGFYVENLTEEYVTCYEDVTQILIKGLSSRKVGATRINSKSSRSHVVFTCILESWCKGTSSKCFGSSKTSRITLVDLAGLEKNRPDDAGRQCLKEDKYVKKTLSQLGGLVNILAEETHSGNRGDVPYTSYCLTHLLRESLGGNAKLTVICTISPDNKSSGETLSTLRFGQRAKLIRNEPVINEITEDDVNDLSDQIRQLKEELIRAKSNVSVGNYKGYFKGRNVRDSLNQLRVSLNRSLILPGIVNDHKEEIIVDEEDVKQLQIQLNNLNMSRDEHSDYSGNKDQIISFSSLESCETFLTIDDDIISCSDDIETEETNDETTHVDETLCRSNLSISLSRSPVLEGPTLSESPKIGNMPQKSLESFKINPDVIRPSTNKKFADPAESLAASLQRGLQIIDHHQRNSASNKSTVSFSFEHLTLKESQAVDQVNASIGSPPEEKPSFLCAACQQKGYSGTMTKSSDQSPEDAGNILSAFSREELEIVCTEQAAKIEQLNHLVEQYNHERDENSIIEHNKETVTDPEAVKNAIIPSKELQKEEEVHGEFNSEYRTRSFDANEKEELLSEIQYLRNKLQLYGPNMSTERLRSSLLSRSIQLSSNKEELEKDSTKEELEKERERWIEMESDWISLTDDLRRDIEALRHRSEKAEMELRSEKESAEELDDALRRAVLGHGRIVEHYADLQEKHNELVEKHRKILEGIAEVKRAAAKAGAKGNGARFAKSLAAELSLMRVEREREREHLKKENKSLRIQLRDTAEAVHAAGELLVRLREAEEATSVAEDNFTKVDQENEKLKKQMEKLKKKHKMEMITMKQYLAESRLPESALRPLYEEDSDMTNRKTTPTHDDDQAWRAEFGAIYQKHY